MTGRAERRRLDYAGAIERLRRDQGMTREALAEASGVSASFLSEVERGLKRPSTDVLAKVAEALGMAPSELLAYVEAPEAAAGESPRHARTTPRKPAQPVLPGRADIAGPQARREWASVPPMLWEDRLVPERAAPPSGLAATPQEPIQEAVSTFPSPPPPAPFIDPRDQAIGMLVAVASKLDEEDLRLLIDLARRLREGRDEPGS